MATPKEVDDEQPLDLSKSTTNTSSGNRKTRPKEVTGIVVHDTTSKLDRPLSSDLQLPSMRQIKIESVPYFDDQQLKSVSQQSLVQHVVSRGKEKFEDEPRSKSGAFQPQTRRVSPVARTSAPTNTAESNKEMRDLFQPLINNRQQPLFFPLQASSNSHHQDFTTSFLSHIHEQNLLAGLKSPTTTNPSSMLFGSQPTLAAGLLPNFTVPPPNLPQQAAANVSAAIAATAAAAATSLYHTLLQTGLASMSVAAAAQAAATHPAIHDEELLVNAATMIMRNGGMVDMTSAQHQQWLNTFIKSATIGQEPPPLPKQPPNGEKNPKSNDRAKSRQVTSGDFIIDNGPEDAQLQNNTERQSPAVDEEDEEVAAEKRRAAAEIERKCHLCACGVRFASQTNLAVHQLQYCAVLCPPKLSPAGAVDEDVDEEFVYDGKNQKVVVAKKRDNGRKNRGIYSTKTVNKVGSNQRNHVKKPATAIKSSLQTSTSPSSMPRITSNGNIAASVTFARELRGAAIENDVETTTTAGRRPKISLGQERQEVSTTTCVENSGPPFTSGLPDEILHGGTCPVTASSPPHKVSFFGGSFSPERLKIDDDDGIDAQQDTKTDIAVSCASTIPMTSATSLTTLALKSSLLTSAPSLLTTPTSPTNLSQSLDLQQQPQTFHASKRKSTRPVARQPYLSDSGWSTIDAVSESAQTPVHIMNSADSDGDKLSEEPNKIKLFPLKRMTPATVRTCGTFTPTTLSIGGVDKEQQSMATKPSRSMPTHFAQLTKTQSESAFLLADAATAADEHEDGSSAPAMTRIVEESHRHNEPSTSRKAIDCSENFRSSPKYRSEILNNQTYQSLATMISDTEKLLPTTSVGADIPEPTKSPSSDSSTNDDELQNQLVIDDEEKDIADFQVINVTELSVRIAPRITDKKSASIAGEPSTTTAPVTSSRITVDKKHECRHCHVTFCYLSTYLAHKKFYCSATGTAPPLVTSSSTTYHEDNRRKRALSRVAATAAQSATKKRRERLAS